MQSSANILTLHELGFISDEAYPITKRNAMHKLQLLFAALGDSLLQNSEIQAFTQQNSWKISKGENYRDLPYMVIDHPKINGRDFPYLMRTMFWWGRYFSFNFFLRTDLFDTVSLLKQLRGMDARLMVLVSDDLWEQDLDSTGFEALHALSPQWQPGNYLKISAMHPIKKPEDLIESASGFYSTILRALSSQ